MVTSCFSHATLPHFLFNNLALLSIGPTFEGIWTTSKFVTYYLTACVGSSAFSNIVSRTAYKHIHSIPFATVAARYSLAATCLGASGAIAALFTCYACMFPHAQFGILFLPFHFDALNLIQFFLAFDTVGFLLMLRRGYGIANLGHQAHIGGYVMGYILYKCGNPWDYGFTASKRRRSQT